MPASAAPPESKSPARLPELFGHPTQLLGWQGITLTVPQEWNPASFGGDFFKGNLRLTDDDVGMRLEFAWEQPKSTPDVARSVNLLLQNIAREAKKKKHDFEIVENAKVLSRTRREHADKEQITSFGWIGDKGQPVAHGWGAAWNCPVSNRVVVAHILGRGTQSPDKTRRLAAELLNTCISHGAGGWQTWSIFDLQLEVPDEFHLIGAKLQTGRLEFDWERVRPTTHSLVPPLRDWGRRLERIGLRRISAANVVLENETLEDWSRRVAAAMFKLYRLSAPQLTRVLGTEGYALKGALRDWRRDIRHKLFDKILRRRNPAPHATVWQNDEANKIFVLLCDLQSENAHVAAEVLDSIQSE